MVAGNEGNLKITTTRTILPRPSGSFAARMADIRVGQGFDVHPFGPGDGLMIWRRYGYAHRGRHRPFGR